MFRKNGNNRKDKKVSNNPTPVWGIVSEPVRGKIAGGWSEFIPSSHVKFIEQTGAKVVQISYKLPKDQLYSLLN